MWFSLVKPSTRNDPASSAIALGSLLSRRRWFRAARAGARNGRGARRNDAWGLPGDAGTLIFGRGALRGDAWEGLIDVPGAVFEGPVAVFDAWAAVLAAGALKSDEGWSACQGSQHPPDFFSFFARVASFFSSGTRPRHRPARPRRGDDCDVAAARPVARGDRVRGISGRRGGREPFLFRHER